MADQTRLDRLNQGLDRLNAGGKLYIERLTSRLLQDKASVHSAGPAQTAAKTTDPERTPRYKR